MATPKKKPSPRRALKPAKKAAVKRPVSGITSGKKSTSKKVAAKKVTAKKAAQRKASASTASRAVRRTGKVPAGLPPLIQPSKKGVSVMIQHVRMVNNKSYDFVTELIRSERYKAGGHVYDLLTQRDEKGHLIIDVHFVRKDGIVAVPGQHVVVGLAATVSKPLADKEYIKQYSALKESLKTIAPPDYPPAQGVWLGE